MQSSQRTSSPAVAQSSAHAAHLLCQATGALSLAMEQREQENWAATVGTCFHIVNELQRYQPQLTDHAPQSMSVQNWSGYVRTINQVTDMIFLNFAPPWHRHPSREDAKLATEMTTMLLSTYTALNAQ